MKKLLILCVFALAASQNLSAAGQSQNPNKNSTWSNAAENVQTMPSTMMPKRDQMHSLGGYYHTDDTSSRSIVEVIASDPSFKTLSEALIASDLISKLSSGGPYTFFAPSDEAFAKISPNALSDLLKPEGKEKLVAILSYHIVPGQKIGSEQLKTAKLNTLQGKPVNVQVKDHNATVNNSKILKSEVPASNGVIYTIDTVLIP